MIPVSLSLRNLLSYGESVPTLDFSPFHVACISGRNGHGKSALLDAMTWALWGEARKPPGERKPDESLLRIGATDMRVDFEFDLEGDRYRVTRSYRKTGKGSASNLELQIHDPAAGYRTLSEDGSVRRTQARINNLLRMSYDTFTNAAFLLQGQADEFTRRSARERKTILGEILGLSRYDDLSALARTHVQRLDIEAAALRQKLEDIAETVARLPELRKNHDSAVEGLQAAEVRLAEMDKQLAALQADQSRVEFHRKELEDLKESGKALAKEREEIDRQTRSLESDMRAQDDLIQKREQILAEAERYVEYREKDAAYREAVDTLRALENEKNRLEKAVAEAKHEIERRLAEWEGKVREAENDLAEAEEILKDRPEIEKGLSDLKAARERVRTFDGRLEQAQALERSLNDARRALEAKVADARGAVRSLEDRRTALEQAGSCVETSTKNLEAAKEREAEAKVLEAERSRVFDEGNRCKAQIESIEQRKPAVDREIAERLRRQETLGSADGSECPLCGSDLDDQHRDVVNRQLEAELDELRREKKDAVEKLKVLHEERDDLRKRYQQLKEKLAEMGDPAAEVARAETALKAASDARVSLGELDMELSKARAAVAAAQSEGPEAQGVAEAARKLEALGYDADDHRAAREAVDRLSPFEGRRLQLEAAGQKQSKTQAELPELRRKRDTARLYLEDRRYAEPEQESLKEIQQKIDALGYDGDAHRAVSEELTRLKDAPAMKERLLAAQRERESVEKRLAEVARRRSDVDTRTNAVQERIAELDKALASAAETAAALVSHKEAHASIRAERDRLLTERASLQADITRCQEMDASRGEQQERLKAAERESRIYSELVTAFGKDGIQSLLIEQAIPDIEEEANRILGRLTDNRTQVTLESLRDLKKGGTRETLDIRISDELGERSYELYSGGEAFRVDFALRIALSRLLAHRAGTRLRTLVIDEGFGTQDADGLERLVEAIQGIRDDFEKILVITHVDALKNAFPVRIEVTKHPDVGSRFEVVA